MNQKGKSMHVLCTCIGAQNDPTLITLPCRHLCRMIPAADNGVLCHVYVSGIDESHHYHKALQILSWICSGGSHSVVSLSSVQSS